MNKLPKGVDQLPSGKYRIRKMINGKRQSLLFDEPPTQRDVLLATNELLNEVPGATLKGTFLDYAEKYIKAKVQGSDNKWVIQNFTKTERSNRKIPLPKELADRIREQGCIYEGFLGKMYDNMRIVEKRIGLPHFGIHRLRSFFASKAHSLGLHDSIILKLGGWKSDCIMKGIYRKALQEDLHEESKMFLDHMTITLQSQRLPSDL